MGAAASTTHKVASPLFGVPALLNVVWFTSFTVEAMPRHRVHVASCQFLFSGTAILFPYFKIFKIGLVKLQDADMQ